MKLHVGEHGSPNARRLVLLHSLALDGSVWRYVVPTLAEKYHTLTVDLRGHGQSPSDTDFTVEDMAGDVAAIIRDQGDESQAIVVGLSLGGCVAQAVAYGYPDLVDGLVLADTTAWYGDDAPQAWRNRAQQARSNGLISLSKFQLERWFSDEFRLANAELCADLLDRFTANDIDSYAATCRALGEYDGRGRVESISVPTEIVVGEHDGATPPADAYDLAGRIEGASVTVLTGAKHLTALERPDALCEAIYRAAKA